ncbi:spore germination protein [Sporosarcina newyorkensis]|uniref:Spore germination protein KA n=1 Tax=Sporosarcina newyorkensis TaxID=759851 RepID=A0A1T4XIQ2_9BACL|nr:spore germination protein [Sporosarcina newyorkensis]SKA89449.1 spore germination protein KA [Sporosarcina newyorkensis]
MKNPASMIDKYFLEDLFYGSSDLVIQEVQWTIGKGFVCYFTTLVDTVETAKQIELMRSRSEQALKNWGTTAISTVQTFNQEQLIESICSGMTLLIFPEMNIQIQLSTQQFTARSPDEPIGETTVRGSHEGFVESLEQNLYMIRKRLAIPDLVIRTVKMGKENNSYATYIYIDSLADPDVVLEAANRLKNIPGEYALGSGQMEDYLEDTVYSPFPQLLNTERPDRVVENLLEGKIAFLIDHSPTVLIGPVTFFSFFQSPDDYNARPIVGTFYRLLRLGGLAMAVLLPAFYIAVVSYHFEILPNDISQKVKLTVNDLPYRPIIEALFLELFIELIREASLRLPTPIGPTIGIGGGLVIGDAVVNAGLVSNIMIVVVAITAISSYVIPSPEMNMSIRIIRFPFMIMATLFGFFGMSIMALLLYIHLLNLSSLKQPYFSPLIPFDASRLWVVFLRLPFFRHHPQQKTFSFFRRGRK